MNNSYILVCFVTSRVLTFFIRSQCCVCYSYIMLSATKSNFYYGSLTLNIALTVWWNKMYQKKKYFWRSFLLSIDPDLCQKRYGHFISEMFYSTHIKAMRTKNKTLSSCSNQSFKYRSNWFDFRRPALILNTEYDSWKLLLEFWIRFKLIID